MLRRFNSLIKGPKGQISDDDLNAELHVSLRPALSVDSSLSQHTHHHVNPLHLHQLPRTQLNNSTHRPPSENGQTGQSSQPGEHPPSHGFVIARVPEEKSWKEGYEHGIVVHNPLHESPEKPPPRGETRVGGVSAQPEAPRVLRTSSDAVNRNVQLVGARSSDFHSVLDVPDAEVGSGVDLETVRNSAFSVGPGRTISSWSTDSAAEHCRICQQSSAEPLIDLGCQCRGEMAKSHKSCIEVWFKNKGTNKCEVCQHVATNIAAPPTSPAPHFWVWRLGGPYSTAQTAQASPAAGVRGRVGLQSSPLVNRPVLLTIVRKHPLIPVMWLGLLAFMTYLFVDAINTSTIGYAAMPIGFLFGVLVVLGLGTAVRLLLEYRHERNMQRRIQLLELDPVQEDPAEGSEAQEDQTGPSAV